MDLEGKQGIVTGAGSGIGRHVALTAVARGAHVHAVDVNVAALAETAELANSTKLETHACDVSSEHAVTVLFAEFDRDTTIDFLVNSAGVEGPMATMLNTSASDLDKVFAVNVRGPFLMMKATLPRMMSQMGGSIVNIASIAAFGGFKYMTAYSASKHAILGLTRVAVAEAAEFGIRVNAICPGPIDTGMHARAEENSEDPAAFRSAEEQAVPQGRFGTPDEVADLACYLLRDQAGFINGSAIAIDGGWTATL